VYDPEVEAVVVQSLEDGVYVMIIGPKGVQTIDGILWSSWVR